MAVRIRLMRVGAKGQPSYRLVVADSRTPRGGRYIDFIGSYNPRHQPSRITVDEAKAINWLNKGAQPSDSARVLLERTGVLRKWRQGKAKA
ncbi:MAG: 30S ribosomal protein S16 [Armatimonadetes bacterium]|nr:30S ribosomal protein S16 [Armatimonadota bacterium]